MLLSLLHFAYAISYFSKITWKITFACVDIIFKILLFYFVKDNSFKCFLPLLLDGYIISFLTGTNCDIPAKCMRSSQTYKEALETLEEMGTSFNALYPSFCKDFSAQDSFAKCNKLRAMQRYEAVYLLVIGN